MVSNLLLQKALDEMKRLTGRNMTVFDTDGQIVACTYDAAIKSDDEAKKVASGEEEKASWGEFTYYQIISDEKCAYVLRLNGITEADEMVGIMGRYQIETIISAYKEKYDRDNFFKSLLMDNLMLVDIFDRSKRLHIEIEEDRIVYLIQLRNKFQDSAINSVKNLFMSDKESYCAALDKKNIVVIRRLQPEDNENRLSSIAQNIYNVIKNEAGDDAYVSYGTVAEDLKAISKSYQEAKMALEVGKIFFEDKYINSYAKLGIGRLIYQLPSPLCKMFLKEIFKELTIKDFDEETLSTVDKFFENSLNVSETSRQLFIHRNTLVYRLDKIEKMTGLDLRNFDDAIIFKIALMVSQYMQYVEKLEQR